MKHWDLVFKRWIQDWISTRSYSESIPGLRMISLSNTLPPTFLKYNYWWWCLCFLFGLLDSIWDQLLLQIFSGQPEKFLCSCLMSPSSFVNPFLFSYPIQPFSAQVLGFLLIFPLLTLLDDLCFLSTDVSHTLLIRTFSKNLHYIFTRHFENCQTRLPCWNSRHYQWGFE